MSSPIYQDELIFPFDESFDVVMNDNLVDDQTSSNSYHCLDHVNVSNEEDYQEYQKYESEDNPLFHLPKNSLAYMIPEFSSVQRPYITADMSEDMSTVFNSTTLSLDYNRDLSSYCFNMNSFENSLTLSTSTDAVYSPRAGETQKDFSSNVYTAYTFNTGNSASFSNQGFSPPYSFSSQYSPSCDHNALITLPNSPPQADHDVSVSPEGHSKIASNTKQLTCEICNKCFGRPQEVTRHQVCHTREKRFGCPTCDKKFARKDALLRHNRSHSKLKVKDNSSIWVAK